MGGFAPTAVPIISRSRSHFPSIRANGKEVSIFYSHQCLLHVAAGISFGAIQRYLGKYRGPLFDLAMMNGEGDATRSSDTNDLGHR